MRDGSGERGEECARGDDSGESESETDEEAADQEELSRRNSLRVRGPSGARSCCGSILRRWRGRKVAYSGPTLGILDLNLVHQGFMNLANVALNFAMSF